MEREINHDKLMNIRVPETLRESYKEYCEDNGYLLSKRIRFLLKKDMEGELEIKKKFKKREE